MRRRVITGSALAMALTLVAGAQDPAPLSAAPQERATPALGAGVSSGAALYASTCAACHAADLAGSAVPPSFSGYQALRAPPLTGPCALRGFTSAAELLAYVRYNMPIQAPGSLSNGEARDVVAFILARNEIQGAQPLTLAHARTIALADRPGGAACARR